MTPEERAEKIADRYCDDHLPGQCRLADAIASEIADAVEEAHDGKSGTCESCQRYGRQVGMSVAYANAANLLREQYWHTTGPGKMEFNHMLDDVIEQIRSRAAEVGK